MTPEERQQLQNALDRIDDLEKQVRNLTTDVEVLQRYANDH